MQLSPVPPQKQGALIIPQDRPVYEAINSCYFEDELLPAGTVFAWDEKPNQEMRPLNSLAAENMKAYLTELDDLGRKAAEKAGRHYVSLADAHENAILMAKQDAKKVQVLNGKSQTPLMGAKKRGRPALEKITVEAGAPLMGSKNPKLSLDAGKDAVNKSNGGI